MPTRDAMADSLTGLEDRGAFLRALASARQAADVDVVLVALDSHQGARPAGHALKAAAAALSAGLRQGDALFRVGDTLLSGEVVRGGLLAPHWRASLEGTRFLDDADEPLPPGARVVILSGLSGG